jgi:hypothetical protein
VNIEAAASPPPQTFFRRHRWKVISFGLIGLVVLAATLWTLATLAYSYSDGDRIGYVQKLSHRGWVCRTWEGELAMTPVPGATPQIFSFTVRDEAVVKRIKDSEGKRVALHYKEKRGIPSSCFGDTSYFISDVRTLP